MNRKINFLLPIFLLLTSCTHSTPAATQPGTTQDAPATTASTESPSALPPDPSQSSPQPIPSPVTYGPTEFPQGFNPLTEQRVSDPAQLTYPALLLSISLFPPAARPQAGFSFTPFVYEYYITEGSTRHVGVFYGEFPAPEIPLRGECPI